MAKGIHDTITGQPSGLPMLVRGSKVSPWLSFFVITPIQMQERRFSAIMGTGLLKRGGTYMPILLADKPAIDHKADWLLVLEAAWRVGECR
jgi:hypothetical protein